MIIENREVKLKYSTQVGIAFVFLAAAEFALILVYYLIREYVGIIGDAVVFPAMFMTMVLPLLLVFGVLFRRDLFTRTDFKEKLNFTARDILVWFLMLFAVIVLAVLIGNEVYAAFTGGGEIPVPPETQRNDAGFTEMLYTVLGAPLFEEFVYRHALYKPLKKCGVKCGTALAVILPAVLFAAGHGNLFQFVFALPAGVMLAVARDKFNCLAFSAAIHSFNNIVTCIIAGLANGTDMLADAFVAVQLILVLTGTVLLIVTVVRGLRRRTRPLPQDDVSDTPDIYVTPVAARNDGLTAVFWVGFVVYACYAAFMAF